MKVLRSFVMDGKYILQYLLSGTFSQVMFNSSIERAEYLAQLRESLN